MSEQPHRRFVLSLTAGGDDIVGICRSLRDAISNLDGWGDQPYHSLSAGPDYSYTLDVAFDPSVDHDSYFNALDAYLENQKGQPSASVCPVCGSTNKADLYGLEGHNGVRRQCMDCDHIWETAQ